MRIDIDYLAESASAFGGKVMRLTRCVGASSQVAQMSAVLKLLDTQALGYGTSSLSLENLRPNILLLYIHSNRSNRQSP